MTKDQSTRGELPIGFTLPHNIVIDEILGSPYSEGNHVYHCRGSVESTEEEYFLKVAKEDKESDLANEAEILTRLKGLDLPIADVLAWRNEPRPWLALRAVHGYFINRFVNLDAADYELDRALVHFDEFGQSLGRIHDLKLSWRPVRERRFHRFLNDEILQDDRFHAADRWLRENEPCQKEEIFIHGDHHYANVLWSHGKVEAVLDWEICGEGWREFDISWAIIVRPRQNFLHHSEERSAVLDGYLKHGSFHEKSLQWCEILNTLHFASNFRSRPDQSYTTFSLRRIESMIESF